MNKIKLSIAAILVLYSSISFAQKHYHNSTRDIASAIVIIGVANAVASAIQPTPGYIQPREFMRIRNNTLHSLLEMW